MGNQIEFAKRSHAQRKQAQQGTRERLLEHGLARVLEAGWAGTSIDVVLRECAVPKGSFYHYFESKEAFGLGLIAHYQSIFMRRVGKWLSIDQEQGMTGDEAWLHLEAALHGFLREFVQDMARFDFKRGCLVGSLGQEVASLNEPVRQALLACLLEWEKSLARPVFYCLQCYQKSSIAVPQEGIVHPPVRNAQARQEALAQAQAQALAREFWVHWQGAVLRSLLTRDAQALEAVVRQFLMAVKAWLRSLVSDPAHGATGEMKPRRGVKSGAGSSAAQPLERHQPTVPKVKSIKKLNKNNELQQKLDL